MRSGTTFTGEVFRSYPDSLYLFEPMQYLSGNVGYNNITYMNGTQRFYDRTSLHDLHASAIRNLLLCRFHEVPADVFKTSHFLYHNNLKSFYNCVLGVRGNDTLLGMKCIPMLKQKCERATSFAIKLITVRMEAIAQVMKLLPEVYVIHLVRDPRPALFSQMKVGQVAASNLANESESHCSNLLSDVGVTKQESCFRQNFHRQRYEDLVRDPLGQFEGLFEFVNLNFHPDVKGRIKQIAMRKGVVRKCLYCSNKGDAMAASLAWRKLAHFSHVTEIQKHCDKVMNELGYISANSSADLKNMNFPLTKF